MTLIPAMRGLAALGLAVPLALLGCDPTGGDATVDFGTDPTGTEDGAEEVDDTPYGPENTWHHALASEVPADLQGTGTGVGDIANNFTLVDQFGDEVELYQFYGQVIVIDAFAEW